jgi:ADP-dependent NAD(P)H-hydrate dehydratase / NAD(P)H-hydrate epimerase
MMLPSEVYSASQVRQLEAAAVAAGTPGYTLMQRAGAAAFALLRQRWPLARKIAVVAGPGNNGGDGLVVARAAHQAGLEVTVMMPGEAGALRGEAAQALADLQALHLPVRAFDAALLRPADVVVDALLGIGVRAPLREAWCEAIAAMNQCARPVLALDLPSGLDPDTGRSLPAVRATVTLTFLALKQGLFLADGPEHVGELHCADLQIPTRTGNAAAMFRRLTDATLAAALPPRGRQSHKGQFGRVLVVGGGAGMPGAVRLTAEAALRVGAGLVTVASLPEHLLPVVGARPELMFKAVRNADDARMALRDTDVIVVGPGLGRDAWAREVLAAVLAGRGPTRQLVVDADALNLIAEGVGLQQCADWVLTPHPGEAARLLGSTTEQVQADRPAALRALCARRGGTIVLKGATTLIGEGATVPGLCDRGNPGMSVPGMGDVLAGALAGMLAQNRRPFDAAAAAVYAHAVAGDRCARQGVRGMLALEVAQELRAVLAALP